MRRIPLALLYPGCAAAAFATPLQLLHIDPMTRDPIYYGQVQRPRVYRPRAPASYRSTVSYSGEYEPGTVVVSTRERGSITCWAMVKPSATPSVSAAEALVRHRDHHHETHVADWRPPKAMLRRRPDLPRYMSGGVNNPLCSGPVSRHLECRIHGSNEPWTMGQAVSSGCIRMTNADVDLWGGLGRHEGGDPSLISRPRECLNGRARAGLSIFMRLGRALGPDGADESALQLTI